MFENFDAELFKQIYIQTIAVLSLICLGMVIYRYSILYKLKESKVMKEAAFTDALTGKGNRHKFNVEMSRLVLDESKKFALCFLDLDGFKHINDNMGHDAGDELLIKLSEVLANAMPEGGEVFRLGGDEFAIVLRNINDKQEVEEKIQKVNEEVGHTIVVRDTPIKLEYSLGISIFPEDSKDRVELTNFADAAMYHIKETGKNGYYFHNEALKSRLENKSKMEEELKRAYEYGEFDIDFQPRILIKDESEIWMEALLYWKHKTLGKLRAQYFLDHIESMGLIINVDEVVLSKAIDRLIELRSKGHTNMNMAINLSLRHLMRGDFVDRICSILEKKSFDQGSLMIEITDDIEQSRMEDYKLKMDRIKQYGVKISANNLDTNYETLSLFKKLPIDEIKVSAEYVEKNSTFNKSVLKDIVEFGKDLYYQVVLTRIENDRELKRAIECKVDKIQGNYICEPIDGEHLEEFLKEYPKIRKRVLGE